MSKISIRCLFGVLSVAVALTASAEPETWLLGDDDDRIAVIALLPGDEALFAAAPLQECAAMELPAQIFCCAPEQTLQTANAAASRLHLPPDSLDLLSSPAAQLPSLLPAFAPSHVILTRLDLDCLAILAAAFPDPATRPAVFVPADGPDSADWQMSMAPYQVDAKTEALSAYSLPAPGTSSEFFAEIELDDLPAPDLPPSDIHADVSSVVLVPEPSAPSHAVAPPAATHSASPSPLRPRTRLPSPPPPPPTPKTYRSWADEPLVW